MKIKGRSLLVLGFLLVIPHAPLSCAKKRNDPPSARAVTPGADLRPPRWKRTRELPYDKGVHFNYPKDSDADRTDGSKILYKRMVALGRPHKIIAALAGHSSHPQRLEMAKMLAFRSDNSLCHVDKMSLIASLMLEEPQREGQQLFLDLLTDSARHYELTKERELLRLQMVVNDQAGRIRQLQGGRLPAARRRIIVIPNVPVADGAAPKDMRSEK